MRPLLFLLFFTGAFCCYAQKQFIAVSKKNPSYFSFADGSAYIPVGINMINPSGRNTAHPDSAFAEIEEWMKNQ